MTACWLRKLCSKWGCGIIWFLTRDVWSSNKTGNHHLNAVQIPGISWIMVWISNRLANLWEGQLPGIRNGAIVGSMITYMKLLHMAQKSPAFQMVQFWWGQLSVSHAKWMSVGMSDICSSAFETSYLQCGSTQRTRSQRFPCLTDAMFKWCFWGKL